jgi:hypothetical protein
MHRLDVAQMLARLVPGTRSTMVHKAPFIKIATRCTATRTQ